MNNWQSLVTSFLNIHNVLIKGKCVVQCYSEVFETVHYFNCLIMNNSRVLGWRGTDYQLFCLTDIKIQVVILTPPRKVHDSGCDSP